MHFGQTMKSLFLFIALAASSLASAVEPMLPIRSGLYAFQHKFAEQPEAPSIRLLAQISGRHIVLINEAQSSVFPKGVIAEGNLMWHAKSGQWIISQSPLDRLADEVGGCSDGPEVVDLEHRVYWTC